MADKKVPKGEEMVLDQLLSCSRVSRNPGVRLDTPSLEGEVHLGLDDLGPRRVLPGP